MQTVACAIMSSSAQPLSVNAATQWRTYFHYRNQNYSLSPDVPLCQKHQGFVEQWGTTSCVLFQWLVCDPEACLIIVQLIIDFHMGVRATHPETNLNKAALSSANQKRKLTSNFEDLFGAFVGFYLECFLSNKRKEKMVTSGIKQWQKSCGSV